MSTTPMISNRGRGAEKFAPTDPWHAHAKPEPQGWWATRGWMVWFVVGFIVIVALAWRFGADHGSAGLTRTVQGWQETNRSLP